MEGKPAYDFVGTCQNLLAMTLDKHVESHVTGGYAHVLWEGHSITCYITHDESLVVVEYDEAKGYIGRWTVYPNGTVGGRYMKPLPEWVVGDMERMPSLLRR